MVPLLVLRILWGGFWCQQGTPKVPSEAKEGSLSAVEASLAPTWARGSEMAAVTCRDTLNRVLQGVL